MGHVWENTSLFFGGWDTQEKADQKACNVNEKRLQHSCFPVKSDRFLRTLIVKNIRERLIF